MTIRMSYQSIRHQLNSPDTGYPAPGATQLPASRGRINHLREQHSQAPLSVENYEAWRREYMRKAMSSDAAFLGAISCRDIECIDLEKQVRRAPMDDEEKLKVDYDALMQADETRAKFDCGCEMWRGDLFGDDSICFKFCPSHNEAGALVTGPPKEPPRTVNRGIAIDAIALGLQEGESIRTDGIFQESLDEAEKILSRLEAQYANRPRKKP